MSVSLGGGSISLRPVAALFLAFVLSSSKRSCSFVRCCSASSSSTRRSSSRCYSTSSSISLRIRSASLFSCLISLSTLSLLISSSSLSLGWTVIGSVN